MILRFKIQAVQIQGDVKLMKIDILELNNDK